MTVVCTTYGELEGVAREQHVAFYGIPYAAPPAGERRFRAPEPPASWSGVRLADTPGPAARQSSHPIPGFAASGPQDEDCLYLNVFTPAADGNRRPVLLWIHGGAFTHGTGAGPLYDGGPLGRRGDVVVVTINYRLGAFGYLYLGEHLPASGVTANAGQLDQIAALRWIRDNIAAFGGDPGNVTIFGESAGAAAVGTLLAMPAAAGLFHRAILESGSGRAISPRVAARVTGLFLDELGLNASAANQLLTMDASKILEAQSAVATRAQREIGLAFGPVRDERTVPHSPLDAVSAGSAARVPLIIGTNRDEVKLFASTQRREEITPESLRAQVAAILGKRSPEEAAALIDVYRASRSAKHLPVTNLDILDAISSDARFRIPATRLALAHASHQPDTYVYLFTHESPAMHGSLGACHALELPFVFGTLGAPTQDRFAGNGPEVERLSAAMMDAWLSFARTGRPASEDLPAWPPYDISRPTMIFDKPSRIEHDPFGDERQAIENLT